MTIVPAEDGYLVVDVTPLRSSPGSNPARLALLVTELLKVTALDEVRVRRDRVVVLARIPDGTGERVDLAALRVRLREAAERAWNTVWVESRR